MRGLSLSCVAFSLLVACGGAEDDAGAGGSPDAGAGGAAGGGGGGLAGMSGGAGASGASGAAGAAGAPSEPLDSGSDTSVSDASTSDASVGDAGGSDAGDAGGAKCCLTKPPGKIPTNGGWNDCPYSGSGRQHSAIDYSSAQGTPIPAGMDGVIQYVRYNDDPNCYDFAKDSCSAACKASGDFIVLKSACGDPLKPSHDFYVRYHHINGVKSGVKVGTKVQKGDVIAFVGQSGCATGPHVHLQTASFAKGKYSLGQNPVFYDCNYLVNPSTRYCSNL